MLLNNELIFLAAEKTALADATGSFSRQVAVLVLEEQNTALARDFLAKVLLAANLNMAQDTLLAEIPSNTNVLIAPDLKERQPKQVLVFGLQPAQLGLWFEPPLYQPLSFYGSTWLFADKIAVLEPDKAKKAQLWSAIKQIFL